MRFAAAVLVGLATHAAYAAAPPFPGAVTRTFAGSVVASPIPDDASLVSLVDVVDLPGTVVDVDVAVDIEHSAADQLDLTLISPSGTAVTLSTDNGGSNDDVFAGALFDDQATGPDPSAPNVRNLTYANGVAIGAAQPEEALAAVRGEPAEGPWALVIVDDQGGQSGTLVGWTLTVTVMPPGGLAPAAPVAFAGDGGTIPDNSASGRTSTVDVAGLGRWLYDVDVAVDITHDSSGQLELFLEAPSGRRIDLVTRYGGGNDDLYAGTTFDDQAGTPIADADLPDNGTAFGRIVGEGALGAFAGEDPNGTWTLTVADRQGGTTGTLHGWTLALQAAAVCGDGLQEAGEQCEDGNQTDGDGCDGNCTPTGCGNGVTSAGEDCDDGNTADGDACPATCRLGEVVCDDCIDDDGNGLVDAADPACAAAAFTLRRSTVRGGRKRKTLTVTGTLPLAGTPAGSVGVQVADASGSLACGTLGPLRRRGGHLTARGRIGRAAISVAVRRKGGRLRLTGRRLDAATVDEPPLTLGLRLGDQLFAGTGEAGAQARKRPARP